MMGFLKAVYDLGKSEVGNSSDPEWGDIDNFLSLPLPLTEDQNKNGRVIRVWLEVKDPFKQCLEVTGVGKIDVVDFLAGEGPLQEKRRKYLYKDPAGANVSWSYSPIYKLGRPKKSDREKLEADVAWKENNQSRFYKLYSRVLADFEREEVFVEGSVDLIMDELVNRRSELVDLWSDSKKSYILMFGCHGRDGFLYPGDIPAFVSYFRDKLKAKSSGGGAITCAFCGQVDESGASLSDVFKFATFDKASFLPGNNKKFKSKVFPICQNCNALLTKGKDVLRSKFTDNTVIRGINIDIVPELIFEGVKFGLEADKTSNFIKNGLKYEEKIFSALAQQGEGLVFHFIFWEKNNAQERVYLMVEDVPPTRLKRLEEIWRKSLDAFSPFSEDNNKSKYLDFAISNIVGVYLDLAGSGDNDKKFQMDACFKTLGQLLNGNKVDIRSLKTNMVARFSGLFASEDWPTSGSFKMGRMFLILDFINRVNKGGR